MGFIHRVTIHRREGSLYTDGLLCVGKKMRKFSAIVNIMIKIILNLQVNIVRQ